MSTRSPLQVPKWISRTALALALSVSMVLTVASANAEETTNRLASNRLASNRLASNRLASNRLASNRLASNRLASNRLASNGLANDKLASTRLQANSETADMLNTADGREVYSYIVSCALPEGTMIEADVPGAEDTAPPNTIYSCNKEHCVFSGSVGLAEHWIDRRLDQKGQRWVTACLLARVNHYGVTEIISMRGVAPELSVSPEEAEQYSLQEGAFYGNLFADGDGPLDWNACRGKDKAASPTNAGLELRACAEPDPNDPTHTVCGFKYAGDCGSFAQLPERHACLTFDAEDGTYGDCIATEENAHDAMSKLYREVITTYVKH
jgi:hypothetical protein